MNEEQCNCIRCGWCCTDMEVRMLDLVNPKYMMSPKGFEFWQAHGLQKVWEENGMVKIIHRCQHLDQNNLCGIEQDKPDFCRDWVCRRHLQDQRWFQEREGQMAKETLDKIMWAFFGGDRGCIHSQPCGPFEAIKALLIEHSENVKGLKEVQMPMYGANHGPQVPPPQFIQTREEKPNPNIAPPVYDVVTEGYNPSDKGIPLLEPEVMEDENE